MTADRDWSPFVLSAPGKRAPAPRAIQSPEGVGDRLRAAAFAEIQARDAFLWAADTFADAAEDLRTSWRDLAQQEDKHLTWLLTRLAELGFAVSDRPVTDMLWKSFLKCTTARDFAIFMATAEERGRRAGERFFAELKTVDPTSAEIFRKIAEEEVEHIRLAERHFGFTVEAILKERFDSKQS